ncbi:MAG: secretin N-terminal domain-containing protein [Candidatus Eremiobacteraeota bacterium]|nr:secretin N-terminal domain-containing protein [Candidatus Eremiobacteraeota bacterium]
MTKYKIIIVVMCLIALSAAMPSPGRGEEPETITSKVFRLCYLNAVDTEKLVRIFLSKEGQAVSEARTNILIVKDYPSVIEEVSKFIKEHDVPQPQVRIWVNFFDSASFSQAGWGANAMAVNNNWRVALWAGSLSQSSSVQGTMNLMTISGTWGSISCGENVPQASWFFSLAQTLGYITEIPLYREVSTGFAVMPVVRGEEVELTVAPQISYFTDRERGTIRFDKLSATVRVPNGQSAVLAAGEGEQSSLITMIFGSMRSRQSQAMSIVITPLIDRR